MLYLLIAVIIGSVLGKFVGGAIALLIWSIFFLKTEPKLTRLALAILLLFLLLFAFWPR